MNRGIARRLVFETRAEMRMFLALTAKQVRRGRLEIHAFCLMGTHFHLLVRSPRGALSEAMQRIENGYVRWFNRRHRRDGPLLRGRFRSKPVKSEEYRRVLVRYIDHNPVHAQVVQAAADYAFCSARAWHAGRIPPWLETSWILRCIGPELDGGLSPSEAYAGVFGTPPSAGHRDWVHAQQASHRSGANPSMFASGAPERVRNWLQRKAKLADGSGIGPPVVGADHVRRAIAGMENAVGEAGVSKPLSRLSAREVLETALLRDLCGMRWREIAMAVGVSTATAHRRYQIHRDRFSRTRPYADLAVQAARRAVRDFIAS